MLLALLAGLAPAAAAQTAAPSAAEATGTDGTAVRAALRFIATLDDAERSRALTAARDRARARLRFTPGSRFGFAIGDMDAESREACWALLRSVLDEQGLATVRAIIVRERLLGRLEGRPRYRDPGLYHLAVFGAPGSEDWGVRFEGHHLSLNLGFSGERLASFTPLFLGFNPDFLDDGSLEPLAGPLGDALVAFVEALPAEQRARAASGGLRLSEVALDRRRQLAGLLARLHRPLAGDEAWIAASAGRLASAELSIRGRDVNLDGPTLRFRFSQQTRDGVHVHSQLGDGEADFNR